MLSEVQMEAIHITEPHYEMYSVFSFDFWCVFQSGLQRFGDFGFQWLLLCHFPLINYRVYICKDLQLGYFVPTDPKGDLSVNFSYFLFIIAAVWHGNMEELWETDIHLLSTLVFCTDNIW